MNSKWAIAGLTTLFLFPLGFLLSRAGKPYGTLLFTLHKVLGAGLGAYVIYLVFRQYQSGGLNPLLWLTAILTLLTFLAMIATGGLMSAVDVAPAIAKTVHKFVPYAAILAAGLTLFLLPEG